MKKALPLLLIVLIGSVFYSLTLRGVYGNPISSDIKNNLDQATMPLELSPERGRFILTQALVEDNTFVLNTERAQAAFPDIGYYEGNFFTLFAPGVSILAIPFYKFATYFNMSQVGTFALVSLFAIVNMLLIYVIGTKVFGLTSRVALISAIVFAFASTSWSYAITLYQHHLTTFALLSTFLAAWKYAHSQKKRWLYASLVWIIYGFSIFIDVPNVVLVAPSVIYLVLATIKVDQSPERYRLKISADTIIASLLFFAIIFMYGVYNQANFGDWRRISQSLTSHNTLIKEGLIEIPGSSVQKVDTAPVEEVKDEESFGFVTIEYFKEERLPNGFYTLLFSDERGLFVYTPIFILSLLGIYSRVRRKKMSLEMSMLIAALVVHIFLYSSWGDPAGGWAFGPRYLIPSMAILSLFVGYALMTYGRTWVFRLTVAILFAYSSFIALLGALTTSAIPPKVEAAGLNSLYNYALNFEYFKQGRSSSFVYNFFASNALTLQQYFALIYVVLIAIILILLFVQYKKSYEH